MQVQNCRKLKTTRALYSRLRVRVPNKCGLTTKARVTVNTMSRNSQDLPLGSLDCHLEDSCAQEEYSPCSVLDLTRPDDMLKDRYLDDACTFAVAKNWDFPSWCGATVAHCGKRHVVAIVPTSSSSPAQVSINVGAIGCGTPFESGLQNLFRRVRRSGSCPLRVANFDGILCLFLTILLYHLQMRI